MAGSIYRRPYRSISTAVGAPMTIPTFPTTLQFPFNISPPVQYQKWPSQKSDPELAILFPQFSYERTSKGLFIHRHHMPTDQSMWGAVILAAMGSRGGDRKQIDGIGGATSTTSKVAIISKFTQPDADVDYTFAQVAVRQGKIDFSGNCGNMASGVDPFVLDEGLVRALPGQTKVSSPFPRPLPTKPPNKPTPSSSPSASSTPTPPATSSPPSPSTPPPAPTTSAVSPAPAPRSPSPSSPRQQHDRRPVPDREHDRHIGCPR